MPAARVPGLLTHAISLVMVLEVVGGPAGREAIGHGNVSLQQRQQLACMSGTLLPNSARLPVPPVRHRLFRWGGNAEGGEEGGSYDIPGEKEAAVVSTWCSGAI